MSKWGQRDIPTGGQFAEKIKFSPGDRLQLRVVHDRFCRADVVYPNVPDDGGGYKNPPLTVAVYVPDPSDPEGSREIQQVIISPEDRQRICMADGQPLSSLKVNTRYQTIVWDYVAGEGKILPGPPTMFQQINNLAATMGDPRGYDVVVTCNKQGKRTEYHVTPMPPTPIPQDIQVALTNQWEQLLVDVEFEVMGAAEAVEYVGGHFLSGHAPAPQPQAQAPAAPAQAPAAPVGFGAPAPASAPAAPVGFGAPAPAPAAPVGFGAPAPAPAPPAPAAPVGFGAPAAPAAPVAGAVGQTQDGVAPPMTFGQPPATG